jgi:hypothetical protein
VEKPPIARFSRQLSGAGHAVSRGRPNRAGRAVGVVVALELFQIRFIVARYGFI